MKTVEEFMIEMDAYFGGFSNDAVIKDYEEELQFVSPEDLGALLKQIKRNTPVAFKPDIKALYEAIKDANIKILDEPHLEKLCPSCKKRWYTSGICPSCCYDPGGKDTPEEWRKFVLDYREGKVPHFNVAEMLSSLCKNKQAGVVL